MPQIQNNFASSEANKQKQSLFIKDIQNPQSHLIDKVYFTFLPNQYQYQSSTLTLTLLRKLDSFVIGTQWKYCCLTQGNKQYFVLQNQFDQFGRQIQYFTNVHEIKCRIFKESAKNSIMKWVILCCTDKMLFEIQRELCGLEQVQLVIFYDEKDTKVFKIKYETLKKNKKLGSKFVMRTANPNDVKRVCKSISSVPNFLTMKQNIFSINTLQLCLEAMSKQKTNRKVLLTQFCKLALKQKYPQDEVKQFQVAYQNVQYQHLPFGQAITMYTAPTFLYELVNKMLRVVLDPLILYYIQPFFIDLFNDLTRIYRDRMTSGKDLDDNFECYRGACFNKKQIDNLTENVGKNILLLGFLSASCNRSRAEQFATNALLIIKIDETKSLWIPSESNQHNFGRNYQKGYAKIDKFSLLKSQEEVLFNPLSLFKVVSILQSKKHQNLVQITLQYGVNSQSTQQLMNHLGQFHKKSLVQTQIQGHCLVANNLHYVQGAFIYWAKKLSMQKIKFVEYQKMVNQSQNNISQLNGTEPNDHSGYMIQNKQTENLNSKFKKRETLVKTDQIQLQKNLSLTQFQKAQEIKIAFIPFIQSFQSICLLYSNMGHKTKAFEFYCQLLEIVEQFYTRKSKQWATIAIQCMKLNTKFQLDHKDEVKKQIHFFHGQDSQEMQKFKSLFEVSRQINLKTSVNNQSLPRYIMQLRNQAQQSFINGDYLYNQKIHEHLLGIQQQIFGKESKSYYQRKLILYRMKLKNNNYLLLKQTEELIDDAYIKKYFSRSLLEILDQLIMRYRYRDQLYKEKIDKYKKIYDEVVDIIQKMETNQPFKYVIVTPDNYKQLYIKLMSHNSQQFMKNQHSGQIISNIGNFYFLKDKNYQRAFECYEIGGSIFRKFNKINGQNYQNYIRNKGQVLFQLGRYQQAFDVFIEFQTRSFQIKQKYPDKKISDSDLRVCQTLCYLYFRKNQYKQCQKEIQKWLNMACPQFIHPFHYIKQYIFWGDIRSLQNQYIEAISCYESCRQIYINSNGEWNHWMNAYLLKCLAEVYEKIDILQKSYNCYKLAASIYRKCVGLDLQDNVEIQNGVQRLYRKLNIGKQQQKQKQYAKEIDFVQIVKARIHHRTLNS